jgi:hypothetical protein
MTPSVRAIEQRFGRLPSPSVRGFTQPDCGGAVTKDVSYQLLKGPLSTYHVTKTGPADHFRRRPTSHTPRTKLFSRYFTPAAGRSQFYRVIAMHRQRGLDGIAFLESSASLTASNAQSTRRMIGFRIFWCLTLGSEAWQEDEKTPISRGLVSADPNWSS